jgi:Flp pilus assembly protein TadD
MTRYLAMVVIGLLFTTLGTRAQSPDDLYLQVYFLIQDADSFSEQGRTSDALAKYKDAQVTLDRFQRGYPDWNADVIKFRLNYVNTKIEALQNRSTTAAPPATKTQEGEKPPATAPLAEKPVVATQELEAQLAAVRENLGQLRGEKATLEAKLKEALAAQPAALDPRELTKAEERIRSLQKENELLIASLNDAQSKSKTVVVDTNAVARAQKALEEASTQLEVQKKAAAVLAQEKEALQATIRSSSEQVQAATALRAENELLQKQLAELKQSSSNSSDAAQDLAKARLELASLRSEREILQTEKRALEERVKAATTPAVAAATPEDASASKRQIKRLEKERDELAKQLKAANKKLESRKSKAVAARVQELESQVTALRDRLAPLEAAKLPYTPEELALLSVPGTSTAAESPAATSDTTSTASLSAASASLINQARREFAARQYDSAAEKFKQVLLVDEKNVPALGGLAISELERNRLEEAEKAVRKALEIAPDNASVLSTLGQIKFRQQQYDAAYDALSRAAALDPKNAEVQNLLGVTLSQKGLRGPAENALRRAIQLQPGYGSAHYNLALVYLHQQPPLIELARWHYQKALAAGHPRSAQVEQLLESRKAAR